MVESTRIKRLLYQSMHRGCKETDAILGRFAKTNLDSLSEKQLDKYEDFIKENDWDIYAWLIGTHPLPDEHKNDVVDLIMKFDFTA